MAVIRNVNTGYDMNSKRIPGKLSFEVGEVFSARVVNSNETDGEVSLKLPDGWKFDAKLDGNSENIPEGVLKFQVEGFEQGKLVIKLVSGKDDSGNGKADKNSIEDLLLKQGIKLEDGDYEILSKMIKHNMPLTKENISKIKTLLDFKDKLTTDENYEDNYIEKYLESKKIDIFSDKGKELKATLKSFFDELKNISDEDILSLYENGIELTEENIKSFNKLVKQDSAIYKDISKLKQELENSENYADDELTSNGAAKQSTITEKEVTKSAEVKLDNNIKQNLDKTSLDKTSKEASVKQEVLSRTSGDIEKNQNKNMPSDELPYSEKEAIVKDEAADNFQSLKLDIDNIKNGKDSLIEKAYTLLNDKDEVDKNINSIGKMNIKDILEQTEIDNKNGTYKSGKTENEAVINKASQDINESETLINNKEAKNDFIKSSGTQEKQGEILSKEGVPKEDLSSANINKEVKGNSTDEKANNAGSKINQDTKAGQENISAGTQKHEALEQKALSGNNNSLGEKILLKDILKEQINMKTEEMKNTIRDILDKKTELKPEIYEKVINKLSESVNDFKVFNSISNQYYYLDLPINIRNDQYQCKIIIKDDRKKEKKIDSKNVKFAVSVKTNNLGVVDAYIKVKNIDINIDLRCNGDFIKLLKSEKEKLVKEISSMGYNTSFNVHEKIQDMNLINCREFFEDTDISTINVKV